MQVAILENMLVICIAILEILKLDFYLSNEALSVRLIQYILKTFYNIVVK